MERENFSYLIFVGGRPFFALVDVWNSYETMTATKCANLRKNFLKAFKHGARCNINRCTRSESGNGRKRFFFRWLSAFLRARPFEVAPTLKKRNLKTGAGKEKPLKLVEAGRERKNAREQATANGVTLGDRGKRKRRHRRKGLQP